MADHMDTDADVDVDVDAGLQVEMQDMDLDGDDEMDSDPEQEEFEGEGGGVEIGKEMGKKEEVQYPFSLAPAIYMPFRGFDDSSDGECPPSDVERPRKPQFGNPIYINALTKIIKNTIIQQNVVRSNMRYLTQQRANQIYAKAREDLQALGPEAQEEERIREQIPPSTTTTTESLPPRPTSPWRHEGGPNQFPDIYLTPHAIIRKKLYREIATLVERCANELEYYDDHATEVLDAHRTQLEKMGGDMDGIMKEMGLVRSPVSPTDVVVTPREGRRDSDALFSPSMTSPPAWRPAGILSPGERVMVGIDGVVGGEGGEEESVVMW